MSCYSTAETFVQPYACAMALEAQHSPYIRDCAEALAVYYLLSMNALTFGQQATFQTEGDAVASIMLHLSQFEDSGLGFDIRLQRLRVETILPASALR